MAEVKAQLNYLRIAPRKVRLVTQLIKDMDYIEASMVLRHLSKKSANSVAKLLDSAAANAENNFDLVKENLYVKDIKVDEGMKLKRMMPRARGMGAPIQKKTSNITLVLDERVKGMKRKPEEKTKQVEAPKTEEKEVKTEKKSMPEAPKEMGRKGFFGKFDAKKLFRKNKV